MVVPRLPPSFRHSCECRKGPTLGCKISPLRPTAESRTFWTYILRFAVWVSAYTAFVCVYCGPPEPRVSVTDGQDNAAAKVNQPPAPRSSAHYVRMTQFSRTDGRTEADRKMEGRTRRDAVSRILRRERRSGKKNEPFSFLCLCGIITTSSCSYSVLPYV